MIHLKENFEEEKVIGKVEMNMSLDSRFSPYEWDPRLYGIYLYKKPISQLILENEAEIKDIEKLETEDEKIACYVSVVQRTFGIYKNVSPEDIDYAAMDVELEYDV